MRRLQISLGKRIRTSKPAATGRSGALPALLGTALGIVGSLAVAWLNSHLADERDRQMRFRNERLELYVSVLDAAEDQTSKFSRHVASRVGTIIGAPQVIPAVDKRFANLIRQMELTSEESIDIAYTFEVACTIGRYDIDDRPGGLISREVAVRIINGCSDVFRKLVVSLRKDLGTSTGSEKLSKQATTCRSFIA